MAPVFISYRRTDSNDATGRIHDHLELFFGPDIAFRDIDGITVGDFPDQLDKAVNECRLMLVVIGPQWINTTNETGRRLDNPKDFVRQEIAAGLARKIQVVPIIVSDGRMPRRDELPDCLQGLERQQAFEIRSARDFHRDMHKLCAHISRLTGLAITDYAGLLSDCRDLGLTRATRNFVEDRSMLGDIAAARELLIVMNDGRSWIDSNQEIIQSRVRDPDKQTKIVLLHPKSPFIDTLILKNKKTATRQVEEIRHSFNIIKNSVTPNSHAWVKGHYGFNPYTLIITETAAILSPYYFMESGALPMFKYRANDTGGLYGRLKEDAQRLFDSASDLEESSFG